MKIPVAFALCLLAPSLLAQERGPTSLGSVRQVHAPRVLVADYDAGGAGALQAAIDAARSGDAILIRPSATAPTPIFFPVQIAGKGLFLFGEGAEHVRMHTFTVRDVPAGESVVLRNVSVSGIERRVQDCAGTVWFEDCAFVSGGLTDGLLVTNCDAVVLVGCVALGQQAELVQGASGSLPKRWVLRAEGSSVHAFESLFLGPHGQDFITFGPFPFVPSQVGGDGVQLMDSFLYASGCTFQGGDGGSGGLNLWTGESDLHRDGGDGLVVDASSEAHVLDGTLQGGAAGGPPAVDGAGSVGVVDLLPGRARRAEVETALRSGGERSTRYVGVPFELVLSLTSNRPQTTYLPQHLGPQLVAPPLRIETEGLLGPTGLLFRSSSVPDPALHERRFTQSLHFDAFGTAVLSSASAEIQVPGPARRTRPVASETKLGLTHGSLKLAVGVEDRFGGALAELGDVNGDGVTDLAVGAAYRDDGGSNRGAVWILFLAPDGGIVGHQRISATSGGFGGVLDDGDRLGTALAPVGDLDGNGVCDLAVASTAAAWVLFLQPDGTVASTVAVHDSGGETLSALGRVDDLDGNGVGELAVGTATAPGLGVARGAVRLLFLNADGTVAAEQEISEQAGGFLGPLQDAAWFGWSVAGIGDVDGDGVGDLAVGAPGTSVDHAQGEGAVWILLLNADGTVASEVEIDNGDLGGELFAGSMFGSALSLGDFDGDGQAEVAAGAEFDGLPNPFLIGLGPGTVFLLDLNADGTLATWQEIRNGAGGLGVLLPEQIAFACSLANLGDRDGDGADDLAVGAELDDDGLEDSGAVWLLDCESE